jgi:Zn finger protein HypA/HybF involved in hydrogenase expression
MHERSLVFREVEALLASVAASGTAPDAVTVTLGPAMTQPVAEAAWTDAVRGTVLDGAPVRWRQAGDTLRCLACACEYGGAALTRCPRCGEDGLVVRPAAEITAAVPSGSVGPAGTAGSG